ncbi:hypothetical protein KIW84_054939 [Lathyrus oleraceus]|uniref:Retroviral polymerase SH3-like domain-containing protein n=1 Tax=Pisum sativum TaxID=3888 RepID=A0A9D4WWS2_PEA|nr:hypothetical protein KIW84_054939 [Pisum sativum]
MDSVASSVVAPAGSAEDASALQVQAHEGNYASKQGTNSSRPRNQNSNAQRSNNRVCTHYGCNNHTVETCFIKHGYPLGFRNKAKSQGISAAAANTDSTSSASPQGSTTPSFGFTKEQYDNILALLQQSKSNPVVNSVSTSPFVMTSHSNNVNGYKEGTKGFILYDLENHDIFISRNVVFYETTFPFKSHISPPAISPHTVQNLDDILLPTSQSSFGQQHSTDMTLSSDFSSSTSTDPAGPTSPSSVSPVPTDLTNHNPTASTSSEPTASISSDPLLNTQNVILIIND